jgi:hypothetical protein
VLSIKKHPFSKIWLKFSRADIYRSKLQRNKTRPAVAVSTQCFSTSSPRCPRFSCLAVLWHSSRQKSFVCLFVCLFINGRGQLILRRVFTTGVARQSSLWLHDLTAGFWISSTNIRMRNTRNAVWQLLPSVAEQGNNEYTERIINHGNLCSHKSQGQNSLPDV